MPQPAHWPLVAMLVLTQWAVGMLVVERFLSFGFSTTNESRLWEAPRETMAIMALALAATGLAIANFHHGRPALALRAGLRSRTVWMRREILAFGIFLSLAGAYVVLLRDHLALDVPSWGVELCGWLAAAAGLAAATASGMVFVATKRDVWSARRVLQQFGCSMLLLTMTSGIVALNLTRANSLHLRSSQFAICATCILLDAAAILSSIRMFNTRRAMRRFGCLAHAARKATIDGRIVALLTGPLARWTKVRSICGFLSAASFPLLVASQNSLTEMYISDFCVFLQTIFVAVVALVRLSSEILERHLFFVTGGTQKTPGECRDPRLRVLP